MKCFFAFAAAACLCAQDKFSADFDVRNRFVIGDRGQVYRSIVNLGEGPKLFDAALRYEGRDQVDLSLHNWGGDPDSEARLDMRRDNAYELNLQYRTFAYFNNLPSYANPLLSQGALNSQRAIDLRRRQFDFDFRHKPRARVTPFINFLRTSGNGHGITPFVGSGDEFPVATTFGDTLTSVRGGAQFTGKLWSATVEQGWTGYADSQALDSTGNPGNRNDAITLGSLVERYRGTGSGWFSRGVLQAQPYGWLGFTGHFIYSDPNLEVEHTLEAQGAFRDPATLRPYNTLIEQSVAGANQPRTSGSWTTEVRPHSRWRFRHNWYSDTFQVSGSSPAAALLEISASPRARLNLRYDQSEAELSTDIGKAISLRGGHRYIRSEADLPPASLVFIGSPVNARLERHTALAGASWRGWKGRARIHGEFEGSPGGETYFRTGLQDYRRFAVQGNVRVSSTLNVTGAWRSLVNQNVGIHLTSRQAAATLEWLPQQGRYLRITGSYSWESIHSTATFIDPTFFQESISEYRDRGHHGAAFAEWRLPKGAALYAGGAISRNSGSRPTDYDTPQARFLLPVSARVRAVAEWRWYNYNSLEAFRTHTISAGVQVRIGPAAFSTR